MEIGNFSFQCKYITGGIRGNTYDYNIMIV